MADAPPVLTPSSAPTVKSVAATGGSLVGGAIAILVLYLTGWDKIPDPKVSGAIATLITAVVTFLGAYVVPPGAGEGVIVADGKTRTARVVA